MRARLLRPLVAAAVAALLPLAGCLEGKQEVTVGPEGSGTIQQRFVVDKAKAAELFETVKMIFGGGAMDATEMPDPFAEVWWRKLAEGVDGYSLDKFTDETKEGKRTVVTEAKFTSLPAAARAGAFFFSAVTLEKEEGGGWRLAFRDNLAAARQAAGESSGMDFGAVLMGFEPQLGSLSLSRTVTLPTKVVETNGKLAEDGKTVSWTVDFAKIMEAKDLELVIRFEGSDALKLTAFSHKPNAEALMQRFVEAAPKPPAPKKDEPAPAEPAPAPAPK
jgi:hypothetical protein